jgi:hypothetical protein
MLNSLVPRAGPLMLHDEKSGNYRCCEKQGKELPSRIRKSFVFGFGTFTLVRGPASHDSCLGQAIGSIESRVYRPSIDLMMT